MNSTFTSLILDQNTGNSYGWTVFNLTKNTVYCWRVSVSAERQNSAWSPVWSFPPTNKSAPVAAPTLVSPPNGTTGIPASTGPTLVWNGVEGADSYDFMIAPEPSFGGAIVQWYGYPGTEANIQGLEEFGESKLYWRVRGRNPAGLGPWSEVWMFTLYLYH